MSKEWSKLAPFNVSTAKNIIIQTFEPKQISGSTTRDPQACLPKQENRSSKSMAAANLKRDGYLNCKQFVSAFYLLKLV